MVAYIFVAGLASGFLARTKPHVVSLKEGSSQYKLIKPRSNEKKYLNYDNNFSCALGDDFDEKEITGRMWKKVRVTIPKDGSPIKKDFPNIETKDDCERKCNYPGAETTCYGYSHSSFMRLCRIFTKVIYLKAPFPLLDWDGCYARVGEDGTSAPAGKSSETGESPTIEDEKKSIPSIPDSDDDYEWVQSGTNTWSVMYREGKLLDGSEQTEGGGSAGSVRESELKSALKPKRTTPFTVKEEKSEQPRGPSKLAKFFLPCIFSANESDNEPATMDAVVEMDPTVKFNSDVRRMRKREVYIVSSNSEDGSGEVAHKSMLGVYKWESPLWKQDKGPNYIHEDEESNRWLIGPLPSTLENTAGEYRSMTGTEQDVKWEYYDDEEKKWKEDKSLRVTHEREILCESSEKLQEATETKKEVPLID